jgi:SAM-dependent methyltransferase
MLETYSAGTKRGRALDVGCAVGAAVFHLTRGFNEVVGVDFSQHFVDAANQMKAKGEMKFRIMKQGEIFQDCVTELPGDIDRSRASFYKGDACNLDKKLGTVNLLLTNFHSILNIVIYLVLLYLCIMSIYVCVLLSLRHLIVAHYVLCTMYYVVFVIFRPCIDIENHHLSIPTRNVMLN